MKYYVTGSVPGVRGSLAFAPVDSSNLALAAAHRLLAVAAVKQGLTWRDSHGGAWQGYELPRQPANGRSVFCQVELLLQRLGLKRTCQGDAWKDGAAA